MALLIQKRNTRKEQRVMKKLLKITFVITLLAFSLGGCEDCWDDWYGYGINTHVIPIK